MINKLSFAFTHHALGLYSAFCIGSMIQEGTHIHLVKFAEKIVSDPIAVTSISYLIAAPVAYVFYVCGREGVRQWTFNNPQASTIQKNWQDYAFGVIGGISHSLIGGLLAMKGLQYIGTPKSAIGLPVLLAYAGMGISAGYLITRGSALSRILKPKGPDPLST